MNNVTKTTETAQKKRGEKDVVYSLGGQSCRCVHCGEPAIVLNGVAECLNGDDCVREYGVRD